jgi:cell division protein ZapE
MLDDAQVVSALAARDIVADATQRDAIASLVALLGANGRRTHSGSALAHQGVYCYGLPGRGKSLVVDTVFELASCRKRRLHFHEFLREMNRRLVSEPRGDDRLGSVSRQWLDGVDLLCFDEFHVHDIADAFLMGRFLDTAIGLGTRIVLTSNYAVPADDRTDQTLLHRDSLRRRTRLSFRHRGSGTAAFFCTARRGDPRRTPAHFRAL